MKEAKGRFVGVRRDKYGAQGREVACHHRGHEQAEGDRCIGQRIEWAYVEQQRSEHGVRTTAPTNPQATPIRASTSLTGVEQEILNPATLLNVRVSHRFGSAVRTRTYAPLVNRQLIILRASNLTIKN
jgi:hypothetical protein